MVVSKKRIKEMGKRAREKKASDLVKQYLQNSALAQVAAQCLQEADVTRDTLFSALALGKTSVVDVEVAQLDDQMITAQVFLRNDDGSLEVAEQAIHAELAERMIWQGDDAPEEYGRSPIETALSLVTAAIEADHVNGAGTAGLSSRSIDGYTESYVTAIEAIEPTLQEQIEALLESPDVPDCVRWNFVAGVLEELTLYRWGRGRDPSERTLDAIEACREIADGQTGGESSRRLVSVLSGYNIKVTALNVSHGYSGYFPFDQVGRVPYEWQLAHLRNLIAQHNKHRLPLLLCLKERAQRIKQAPSYGQQLEGVLYAS